MSHAKAARRVGSSQEPEGNLRARSLLPNLCLRISLRSSFPAPVSPPRARSQDGAAGFLGTASSASHKPQENAYQCMCAALAPPPLALQYVGSRRSQAERLLTSHAETPEMDCTLKQSFW